jgi:hypothetical protein
MRSGLGEEGRLVLTGRLPLVKDRLLRQKESELHKLQSTNNDCDVNASFTPPPIRIGPLLDTFCDLDEAGVL